MTRRGGARLELWIELASTYSYLTVARIGKVAEAAQVEIAWRPFLLGPVFQQMGWDDSPFNVYPAKGRYMWRDMERLCEGYGLPFQKPSSFPRHSLLAARVATLAEAEGWCEAWCRAVYHAEFAEDRDIGEPAVLSGLLDDLGRDPGTVLDAAGADATKAALRARTDEAVEAGIFGAPTLRVGEELFWGNDRLGDAIAWAALGPAPRRR
jgi:2-hydroxychromene-2-carboxylate isomerase